MTESLNERFCVYAESLTSSDVQMDPNIGLDIAEKVGVNKLQFYKEISIPYCVSEFAENILRSENSNPNYDLDDTIDIYSTSFTTNYGEYGIDIKFCNGTPTYVEPILIDITPTRASTLKQSLDVRATLLGEYEFEIEENEMILCFKVIIVTEDPEFNEVTQ